MVLWAWLVVGWVCQVCEVGGNQGKKHVTIAAVFDHGGDRKHELAFRHAVRGINSNRDILPNTEIRADIVHIPGDSTNPNQVADTFEAERKTCYLLEKGVVAIFGPRSYASSEHIRSITDSLEIPYIETRWNYRSQDIISNAGEYAVNLHPDITTLGTAYLDLLEAYNWNVVTILYQDNDSMMTLKEIFLKTGRIQQNEKFRLVIKQLSHNENGYRDVLKEIFQSKNNLIVIDCEVSILSEVLRQCQQVGLISQGYYIFLTSLDAHTVDLEDFKYGGTNITAFRMINVEKKEVRDVVFNIVNQELSQGRPIGDGDQMVLDTATALIYDSVNTFAIALHQLDAVQQVQQKKLSCDKDDFWAHGLSLLNYMKMVEFTGLSGPIKFDTNGLRTQFSLDLMELQGDGLERVGSWNTLDKIALKREVKDSVASGPVHPMANKTFIITTVLSDPYTMLVEKTKQQVGNARFEGFGPDLALKLAEILHFNYTFKLVDDSKYGNEDPPGSGEWNGMIGEVVRGEAHFNIADISITSARNKAVAFSMPWMNIGISIMYVVPRASPPSLLAFLDPFTGEVWLYLLICLVFVSILFYVLARFSPYQWEEPINCIKDPEEMENQYNLANSFWFALGALMQQGSDVAPIALCVRFAAGMWFFFALILISSYTANLAAFLTVETLERPIESVSDLAKQNEIKYGSVKGGSTAGFFENSDLDIYQRMWVEMDGIHKSQVMVDSNSAGMEKVEEAAGKYAFFMESSAIEYHVERKCKLSQVGGLLDSKGYGIAMQHNTPYKKLIDNAILKLLEGGDLHKLKNKWWKQKRGGGQCAAKASSGGAGSLGLANVVGVFMVTLIGCAIASLVAFLEFLWGTKQSAKESETPWLEEMAHEIKFIMKCHGNVKEVKTKDDSDDGSSSKSGSNSHSSQLSMGEAPDSPHYKKKSDRPDSPSEKQKSRRRLNVESPIYSHKSVLSFKPDLTEDKKSDSVYGNGKNKIPNGNSALNPFENENEDTLVVD